MMVGWLRRHGYALAVTLLGTVVLIGAVFVVAVALPDLFGRGPAGPGASAAASPSPNPNANVMAWVAMPANADCAACHLTAGGGIGLKPMPKLGHPLDGWNNCTECHATERLAEVAPGHAGIHASECLTCHQPSELPPPLSRPHRDRQNQGCLECHGTQAPLPDNMAHRPETVCWLCHRLPDVEPPQPAHAVEPGQTNCLACHVAGGPPGALPADHAERTSSECLLCHAPATAPPAGTSGQLQPHYTLVSLASP